MNKIDEILEILWWDAHRGSGIKEDRDKDIVQAQKEIYEAVIKSKPEKTNPSNSTCSNEWNRGFNSALKRWQENLKRLFNE